MSGEPPRLESGSTADRVLDPASPGCFTYDMGMPPDPETMCLSRLCAEVGARMGHLAQLPFGPRIQGVRRIQGRPDVFRSDGGRTIVVRATAGEGPRVMPVDARDYLRLLRDGYVSTIPHWQDVLYQISKESPTLVVELWALRREEKPTFEFVEDLTVIELMAAHLMTKQGVVGWWLEYCFKDTTN